MKGFVNEFEVKKSDDTFRSYELSYDPAYDDDRYFGYKVASSLARKLADELKTPVSSLGRCLIATDELKTPSLFTITMKIEGKPTDIEVSLGNSKIINKGQENFKEAAKKVLDRKIDLLMSEGYYQDGRAFFEERSRDITKYYCCHDGVLITSKVSGNGEQAIIVDPATQVRNKQNLLQSLQTVVKRKEIKGWRNVGDRVDEINRMYRSKAHTIRSVYTEIRRGTPQHNVYRFIGFKFDKPLEENSDPRSPVNFHRKYERDFSMDQPEVELIAKGGHKISHIPQLLEEHATLQLLKRFGASAKFQARALMNATDRFYTTVELVKPLQEIGLIKSIPVRVETENFSPVILTIEGDYIEVKNNLDFQRIFEKKKILKRPYMNAIHVFSRSEDSAIAERLLDVLKKAFKDFGLNIPEVQKYLECPGEIESFRDFILKIAKKKKFKKTDLALVVFGLGDEDLENTVYNSIKKESASNLFPVQFINASTVKETKTEKDLRTNVVNLLFLQIVAKCRGIPYGLRPGFAPVGTLFVGIDKYKDPFLKNAPLVSTVTFFDAHGIYVGCDTKIHSREDEANLGKQITNCFRKFNEIIDVESIRTVIYLVDTGIGTKKVQLLKEASECHKAASTIGASHLFVTANKGSHLRLYSGNPSKPLTARRVSSFTAVTKMKDPREILIVSTEPIISRKLKKEIGTPKPVLYTILTLDEKLDLEKIKKTVAKSIIWLCKHSWISPASTRLPAPLFFANKISRFTSITGIPMTPEKSNAPLFL